MQWLVDLVAEQVIATIGIPPVYIDRGDPAVTDFDFAYFSVTNAWTEFDLSAIVPAGAKAVNLTCTLRATSINRKIQFRRHENVNDKSRSRMFTQVANQFITKDLVIACDENRKLDYFRDLIGINSASVDVKGWWL